LPEFALPARHISLTVSILRGFHASQFVCWPTAPNSVTLNSMHFLELSTIGRKVANPG
jgi:hypothetical protein